MTSVMNAVTQVVENSDFAKKGLLLDLLNISAYAKTIRVEVEEITKNGVKSDSSIVMALSRYGRQLRATDTREEVVEIRNITSRSQLVEMVFAKTPEVQERLAMLSLLDAIKRAPFFVSVIGITDITVIIDESLHGVVRAHFGSLEPRSTNGPLASLTLKVGADADSNTKRVYAALEQVALRNISVVEYITTPAELIVILHEKDAGRAYQALHRAFIGSRD